MLLHEDTSQVYGEIKHHFQGLLKPPSIKLSYALLFFHNYAAYKNSYVVGYAYEKEM